MKWDLRDQEARSKWVVAGVISVILLVAIGLGSLIFEDFMESTARAAFLSALNDLSPNATVTINGNTRQNEPVLEALRKVQHIESHHSYPLAPIQVDVRDGAKTIKVVVAQDSERPDEYWVYRPGRNYHNDPLGEFLGCTGTQVFRNDSQAVEK
jgi:hypothetical protein